MRLLFFLVLAGCSGPSQDISDAGTDAYGHKVFPEASVEAAPPPIDCDAGSTPSATYPAAHPKLPLVTTVGGPVIASPRFVPIVFSAEDRTKDIGAFMKVAGGSSWWTLAAQYGVGPATASDPIVVPETPAAQITDEDIQAWLANKLDGTHADFGVPDASAIYVVYYPASTTIYESSLGPSCVTYSGYHNETKVGATKVVYAVIARCDDVAMTSITSHELFEAATDPYFYTAPAWRGVDEPSETPYGAFNDELGDLCEGAGDVTPDDIGYPVQRMWSNAGSQGAHDPCQPASVPYFRTATAAQSISLAPGATTTLDLVAFSDKDTGGPWTIKVTSSAYVFVDKLDLTLCRSTVQNGEHIPLVISRDPASTNGSTVQIESTLGNVSTGWQFTVGN
ncbi:MAG TPA: hypothetical protein VH054_23040 [Polyangiaceae bacterium]|nr:hypothetical protein [Polyangiaceae bacterium]